MESELSQPLIEQVEHEQIIVIERQAVEVANTMCGTGCGFSDMQHRAKDAEIRSSATRKLCLATVLCLIFIAVEVAGGLIANSLAILTDAAHLLSDVAGFAISLFAIWAARWEATPRQTYGFFRLEILGALVSIQLIWLLTGVLVYEAIARLYNSSRLVDGRLMFIVASFGLCCNLIMVFLFGHYDHEHGHGSHGHSHGHHHTEASHGHSHSNHHTEGNPEYNQNECHSDKGHNHRHLHDSHNENYVQNHGTFQENYDHSGLGIKHFPVLANEENSKPVFGYMNDTCSIKGDRRHESHGRLEVSSPAKKSQKSLVPSNINVRGAYLHVFGDLIQSIGVMIGGAIIWAKPSWRIVDLICTFFFSILVLGTTIRMLRDIVEILMESTPREIDAIKLEKGLLEVPGVVAIHELHIWAITMGKTSLACHVIIDLESDADAILQKVIEFCEKGFNIRHVTVQIERAH